MSKNTKYNLNGRGTKLVACLSNKRNHESYHRMDRTYEHMMQQARYRYLFLAAKSLLSW